MDEVTALSELADALRKIAARLEILATLPPTPPDDSPTPADYPADWYSPPSEHIVSQWYGDGHRGIDIACPEDTKLYAPANALVWRAIECDKCTPEKPSSVMQGYPLGAIAVLNDIKWGYGLGTHVVLEIARADLPADYARRYPAVERVYVTYGHMKALAVQLGETVTAGTLLGYSGNTGNSTGAHLHLQVNQTAFTRANNIDPERLFQWR